MSDTTHPAGTTNHPDAITRHLETIMRLANPETLDMDAIKTIYLAAQHAHELREQELSDAAFLASCGPATHDYADEVMEARV